MSQTKFCSLERENRWFKSILHLHCPSDQETLTMVEMQSHYSKVLKNIFFLVFHTNKVIIGPLSLIRNQGWTSQMIQLSQFKCWNKRDQIWRRTGSYENKFIHDTVLVQTFLYVRRHWGVFSKDLWVHLWQPKFWQKTQSKLLLNLYTPQLCCFLWLFELFSFTYPKFLCWNLVHQLASWKQ